LITFIIGGARSGKSSFAIKEASKINGKKAYIATAEALDEEMNERIENHKKKRGEEWDTYEEPLKIGDVVRKIEGEYSVIVIDCLTLWLSNLMKTKLKFTDEIDSLTDVLTNVGATLAVAQNKGAGASPAPTIFFVSNEVGMGIVPDNPISREFRDLSGYLNQRIADIADEAYLVTAGMPIKIK
jgi:adenosylcobinamide kinase/adenosylcobinamide-phosphate guanylyltransferase